MRSPVCLFVLLCVACAPATPEGSLLRAWTARPSATARFSAPDAELPVSGGRLGDLNCDGYDDLYYLTSSATVRDSDGYDHWTDMFNVYYGSDAGISTTAETLFSVAGSSHWLWGSEYLVGVTAIGDVNGDRCADVGLDYLRKDYEDPGWVYLKVVSGGPTGASSISTATLDMWGYTGWLGSMGDVNGDGAGDAAYYMPDDAYDRIVGTAYGESSGTMVIDDLDDAYTNLARLGDMNGDGYDDVGVWPSSGSAMAFLQGTPEGLEATESAGVSSRYDFCGLVEVGDLNGDGFDDVVQSWAYADSEPGLGIYYGGPDGMSSSPDQTLVGEDGDTLFGLYAVGLGDIDGDGLDELAVYSSGNVQLYRGHPDGLSDAPTWTPALTWLQGAGDLNGDGFADTISGTDIYYGSCSDDDEDGVCGFEDCDETYGALTWYQDLDGDGLGDPETSDASCPPSEGWVRNAWDCDDEDASVGRSSYAWVDEDGDGVGLAGTGMTACAALEGSAAVSGDCDDEDPEVHPDAAEIVADGLDNDCDGSVLCYKDGDGDGHRPDETSTITSSDADCDDAYEASAADPADDCDDTKAGGYPDGTETPGDTFDGDCDGTEICYADADGDRYRSATETVYSDDLDCSDAGERGSGAAADCDDGDAAVYGYTTWYEDVDGDGRGGVTSTSACEAPDGYASTGGDCDDSDPSVMTVRRYYADEDGDGFGSEDYVRACAQPTGYVLSDDDCDDSDASITNAVLYYRDGDGDGHGDTFDTAVEVCEPPAGYATSSDDCDDRDPSITDTMTWHVDEDGDGYGGATTTTTSGCEAPEGTTLIGGDCDDSDPAVTVEVTWYLDEDGDGYGGYMAINACAAPEGYVSVGQDCFDSDASTFPGAAEITGDEIDGDCSGSETCWRDGDNDGYRTDAETLESRDGDCDEAGEASSSVEVDCQDRDASVTIYTWYLDEDGDGYGGSASISGCTQPEGTSDLATDCDDHAAGVYPGASERCDAVDEDCDGAVDEDATDQGSWRVDADGDGYTVESASVSGCEEPEGYSAESAERDCNDADPARSPGAEEILDDDIDQDCDGHDAVTPEEEPEVSEKGGWGCSSGAGGSPSAPALLLIGLALLRRRRRG